LRHNRRGSECGSRQSTQGTGISPETLPLFENQGRPAYLMLMTRKALYRPEIERVVRRYEPIFAVRRQKGTLLNVYSNRRLAAREASPSEMVGSR
jgi:hypothetical protein